MRSSSTKSCRSDERFLADRFRGEGFLGPQSFESLQRVRGVAWFERGDHPVFPLTRNPTSLGCWRLRFKSGRTHFHGGTEYRFPRGGLGSCPACRAVEAPPFPLLQRYNLAALSGRRFDIG